MKVADIQVGTKVQIEKRNSDTLRVLYSETQKELYVAEFGNVDVVYDAKYNVYRVPSFAESIAKYNSVVSLHCDAYGCE
jgi:hypothetical protein